MNEPNLVWQDGEAAADEPNQTQTLRPLAALLAAGYLRLLATLATGPGAAPLLKNPAIPVDSVRAKSVNRVEHEGGRDA
jgi:hypothetical protein